MRKEKQNIKGFGALTGRIDAVFNKQKNQNKGGFTLLEVLVVVLIIGILTSVALPQYQKAVFKTRMSEAKILVNSLYYALLRYYTENNYTLPPIANGGHLPQDFEAYLDVSIPPLKNKFGLNYYSHAYIGIQYPTSSGNTINIARDWRPTDFENAHLYCEYWVGNNSDASLRNACISICNHNNFETFDDAIGCRLD